MSIAHTLSTALCQVFKAELDKVKTVAVKFLAGQDLPTIRQFAAEVDMMRACRDNNIVSFCGAWLQQVSFPPIISGRPNCAVCLTVICTAY